MYHAVDPAELTFATPEREAAEAAARELWQVFAALGTELTDIDIVEPCSTCRRRGHRITLGTLHPDEARDLAAALRDLGALRNGRRPGAGTG